MPKILIEWTDENVAKLRRLHSEGYTAQGIANELGAPQGRSAVCGKMNRLLMSTSRTEANRLKAQRKRERIAEAAQKAQEREAAKAEPKPAPEPKVDRRYGAPKQQNVAKAREMAASPDQFGRPDNRSLSSPIWQAGDRPLLSLLKLNEHTCKFPLGDPLKPGFGFCGLHTKAKLDKRGKRVGSYPYCEDHHRITTTQPEARK